MYNERVMQEFAEPKNVGFIENADGVGKVGNASCGDIMEISLKIDNDVITDAKFRTFGCAAAIASSSVATQMVIGKTLDEALNIKNKDVVETLQGLPPQKIHCSVLAEEAIKKARKIYIEDFLPTVDYIINYHIQYGYGKDTMDIVTNIKGEFDFKIVADLGEYYYVTFFKDDIQGLFVNKYDGACYPVNAFSVGIFSVTPVGEHLGWGLSFQ